MIDGIVPILAIVLVIGWIIYNGAKQDRGFEQFDRATAFFIDVRSPAEFSQGTIEGALNFPVQQLNIQLDELKNLSSDGQKQLVLFCRSGARSSNAYRQLTRAGLGNLLMEVAVDLYRLGSMSCNKVVWGSIHLA